MRSWRLLLAVAVLVGAGCGPAPQRHYYSLTGVKPATRFEKPFPVKLRVRELEMQRSYRRDELVSRRDANELTYAVTRRWSEPPQRMISSLLREQVRQSSIAAEIQDDNAATEPDFVLTGDIEAIEQLNLGNDRYAHLAINLRLQRFKDETTVWTYRIDAKRPVSGTSARSTVRVLSEMLSQETDRAIADLGRWFADPDAPRAAPVAPGAATVEKPDEPGVIGPSDTSPLNDLPQLQRDDTPLPVGMGAIFVPTLSDGEREPSVGVDRDGHSFATGLLGERIVVEPGDYEVRVGSGTVSQQQSVLVRVVAGKTTVVPPSWAALDVKVVDDTFLPFRGTYELIRMFNREEYGIGFGADELLGEVTRVWVLPPGLYKLVRTGGTYRDRTDFATVRLETGRLTRFTLVLAKADGSFRGAGEDDPNLGDLTATDDDSERLWLLRAVLGGDLNFNRNDILGTQQGWKLSFRTFFDGSARFTLGPHVWLTRLELEEGQTRLFSRDFFQNDTDRLFFHTIYTYQLLPWFGPYLRVGLETKLLPLYQDFDTPRDVDVLDSQGQVVESRTGVTRVQLGSTFAPLQLKQGAGGNFRVVHATSLDLDLRLGFGARQTLAVGLYKFDDVQGAPGQLKPVADSSLVGFEGTLVGLARLSSFMTLSTELDGLLPVSGDAVVYTWRNQATLRLISFISLVYRFNVVRDPNLNIGDSAQTENDVQLRFSYVLF